jgi:hypothetical protein
MSQPKDHDTAPKPALPGTIRLPPDGVAKVLGDLGVRVMRAIWEIARPVPARALAEVYARQPLREEDPVEWNTGVGFRYQINPYLAVDAGAGRRLTGDPAWHLTIGSAFAFGSAAVREGPGNGNCNVGAKTQRTRKGRDGSAMMW